jgi:predicted Co/Zn/Cd cation transporter (cation efflux family)
MKQKNTIGTAGGVLGIVDASLSFIFTWVLAPLFVVLSIIAVALSAIGLKKASDNDLPKGMAITGLATAIPTLVWNLIWSFVMLAAVSSTI